MQGRVRSRAEFSKELIDTGESCPEPSCAVSYCSGPTYRTKCSFLRVKLSRGQLTRV